LKLTRGTKRRINDCRRRRKKSEKKTKKTGTVDRADEREKKKKSVTVQIEKLGAKNGHSRANWNSQHKHAALFSRIGRSANIMFD
jgi:hypothetical protein